MSKLIYSKVCALGFRVTRYPPPPKDPGGWVGQQINIYSKYTTYVTNVRDKRNYYYTYSNIFIWYATHLQTWRYNTHVRRRNTHASLAVQHTCTTIVRNTLATLAVQPTCTKMSLCIWLATLVVQPTCTKNVPSAFCYLINKSKTIGDIQYFLWQRSSFLTDKVLI